MKANTRGSPEVQGLSDLEFRRAAYGVALLHDGLGVNMQDDSLLFPAGAHSGTSSAADNTATKVRGGG